MARRMGNTLCERRWLGLDDLRRPCQNNGRNSGGLPGIWPDGLRSKIESTRLCSVSSPTQTTLDIEAAGQHYVQTGTFVYLSDAIGADARTFIENNRRVSAV